VARGKAMMRPPELRLFALSVVCLIGAGCASPRPEVHVQEIRGKADLAFRELEMEEKPSQSPAGRSRRDERRPSHDRIVPETTAPLAEGGRPDWVDGRSARYPEWRYLTGVGYGSDRRSAEENARAEIAKVFSSRILSQTRIYEEYLETTSMGKSAQTGSIDIEQITTISTERVLSGVRIAEVYLEGGPDPIYYALALLDRDQSATILRRRIRELDRSIEGLLAEAADQEDVLARIRYLSRSVRKYLLREACNGELRIVTPSGKGIPPPFGFREIRNQLETALSRDFSVGLVITGSHADRIKEALVQALNERGIAVSCDLAKARVLVKGTIEITPLERQASEWNYVRWRIHLDLLDQREGTVFGSLNETGREAHLSFPQAEDRAVRRIQKRLVMDTAGKVKEYILPP